MYELGKHGKYKHLYELGKHLYLQHFFIKSTGQKGFAGCLICAGNWFRNLVLQGACRERDFGGGEFSADPSEKIEQRNRATWCGNWVILCGRKHPANMRGGGWRGLRAPAYARLIASQSAWSRGVFAGASVCSPGGRHTSHGPSQGVGPLVPAGPLPRGRNRPSTVTCSGSVRLPGSHTEGSAKLIAAGCFPQPLCSWGAPTPHEPGPFGTAAVCTELSIITYGQLSASMRRRFSVGIMRPGNRGRCHQKRSACCIAHQRSRLWVGECDAKAGCTPQHKNRSFWHDLMVATQNYSTEG